MWQKQHLLLQRSIVADASIQHASNDEERLALLEEMPFAACNGLFYGYPYTLFVLILSL